MFVFSLPDSFPMTQLILFQCASLISSFIRDESVGMVSDLCPGFLALPSRPQPDPLLLQTLCRASSPKRRPGGGIFAHAGGPGFEQAEEIAQSRVRGHDGIKDSHARIRVRQRAAQQLCGVDCGGGHVQNCQVSNP